MKIEKGKLSAPLVARIVFLDACIARTTDSVLIQQLELAKRRLGKVYEHRPYDAIANARRQARQVAKQSKTLHGYKLLWSEGEYARIATADVTDVELSVELGRTIRAIRTARFRLRRLGRYDLTPIR